MVDAQIGADVKGAEHEGLPILFLHGVGSDKSAWAPQLESFGADRPAIAADYPGYGDSAPVADATREDYARAMWGLLDRLGHSRAILCGLSLGGIVALAMHDMAPHRVAALVLADTFAVHPEGRSIHDGSLSAARALGMRELAQTRAGRLFGTDTPAGLLEEVIETMAAIPCDSYSQGARAVWLADMRAQARRVSVPTLVLCGAEDRVTPPALSDALAGLIAGAERIDIAGAGHLANLERPEAFDAAVRDFISALPANI